MEIFYGCNGKPIQLWALADTMKILKLSRGSGRRDTEVETQVLRKGLTAMGGWLGLEACGFRWQMSWLGSSPGR